MKEIEEDKEEKINLEFQVEQFESKIKIQMKDKEKKEKEYEQYCEDVEKEMIALSTKDQFYEAYSNLFFTVLVAFFGNILVFFVTFCVQGIFRLKPNL